MNEQLLHFFLAHYGRGFVGLVGSSDFVGESIRVSQRKLTPDGQPSLWSHAFIIGEMRPDRRGPGATTGRSPYLFESDIHIDPRRVQLRNGAQENWIGKWCKDGGACADNDLGVSLGDPAPLLMALDTGEGGMQDGDAAKTGREAADGLGG